MDLFGKSEFYFGLSIKPRQVDFELFHQSAEAENCYGPFSATDGKGGVDFSEPSEKLAFGWPTIAGSSGKGISTPVR